MESAGVSSTVCGKRLASRFAARGGPGCAGSLTNTNSGAASGAAFDNSGDSSMCTRTAASAAFAAADPDDPGPDDAGPDDVALVDAVLAAAAGPAVPAAAIRCSS